MDPGPLDWKSINPTMERSMLVSRVLPGGEASEYDSTRDHNTLQDTKSPARETTTLVICALQCLVGRE